MTVTPPMIYNVVLPLPLGDTYSYTSDTSVPIGSFVKVPFGSRALIGIVWSEGSNPQNRPLKSIISPLDLPPLSPEFQKFLDWVSRYTLNPLGAILKMALYEGSLKDPPKPRKSKETHSAPPQIPTLTEDQDKTAQRIIQALNAQSFCPFVLEGVTGSGKTEVYFEAIHHALSMGKQVLIMVPEITLTDPLESRFETRFGVKAALWHADVTPAQKRKTWLGVLKGEINVVIGARSSLFLPFPNLGLMVIDEEHDGSYKQEEGVLYNARDMGVLRAQIHKIPIVLASATPSIETLVNLKSNRYQHLHLPSRFGGAQMPDVTLVDMRRAQGEPKPKGYLSPSLQHALYETLAKGEQSLIFLNRRGYAPLTLCSGCGERMTCPHCEAWLVEHKSQNALLCHHCGFKHPIPKTCPKCGEADTFIACGPGVERIEEELQGLFPEARVSLMTSDTLSTPKQLKEMLEKIHQKEVDIIIGTQIMAKGHHFPSLTLVGVVDGDLGLSGGDLRAPERTYQLLHQVSGRAGRDQWKGKVLIQTFQPDNPVMIALAQQNQNAFMDLEIEERLDHGMPPFGRLIAILATGPDGLEIQRYLQHLVKLAPQNPDIQILGPVPAMMSKLRGKYRWRLLIKGPKKIESSGTLQGYVQGWLNTVPKPIGPMKISIDVDPHTFG